MKRKLFTGILALMAAFTMNTASAQVEQGNFIIDPYYGYPNFSKGFLGQAGVESDLESTVDSDVTNAKLTGLGPCGIRLEYMLADQFGLGVDFIYNSVGVKGNYTVTDSLGNQTTYEASANMQRFRVQLRFNYHFVQTEHFDAYAGVGAGSNTRLWKATSTDPNFTNTSAPGQLLPVSLRLALGARYYFIPNLGLNAEIGLGGPVLSGGISVKI
ncbi:porin family protein [Paracrocinitomix mangrovi]|uniref:outer membrane beta-barrel protein n=1 Tax=Paracrocinitomix mangrovi TaxID=2862509 RepID=UPI001C8F022C|nr:outer membrane beta-barrel protein [Paracrocinitomix mangrovi]UKN01813.1 porin family protein [Paracrocinitomix mangrovi]